MFRTNSFLSVCLLALSIPAQRELDPVVVDGAALPGLMGVDPDNIVAFTHAGGWQQIPVQIDERAVVSYAQIRQFFLISFSALVYTDANTFTGADPDATFDADDELVFMAADAGGPAGFDHPAGVLPGTQQGLAVDDPLGGPDKYVYLYVTDGSLQPGAGQDRVSYTYNLLSGDYTTTYDLGGSNPEDSTVQTSEYSLHFSDRWVMDDASVTAPGASGVDILDRHKFQYAPGDCLRTEDTFSSGGGAMIANIDGPVRAIRSVVGANSGLSTQRDWKFYQGRTDIRTFLRVHPIGSAWTFVDYGPGALGMTYYDNLNMTGVSVDGVQDVMTAGDLSWQLVTGAQGSLTSSVELITDIPALPATSHYFDEVAPVWNQCTGDPSAFAAAGMQFTGLPNTDPDFPLGFPFRLEYSRIIYFEAPGVTVPQAVSRAAEAKQPLGVHMLPGYRLFGAGCAGVAGTPSLRAAGIFEIGGDVVIEVSDLPATDQLGALFFGFSDQMSGGVMLPRGLGFLGAPACFQYVSLDLLINTSSGTGTVQIPFAVPLRPALIGKSVFSQYASLDPGAPGGIVTSNAGEMVIGGDP